ncbi:MAG: hypothetical protein ACFFCS_18110 [Candidatus Hodarchaeota archaeon]
MSENQNGSDLESMKAELKRIEGLYNTYAGRLQEILEQKGDLAAEDPEYGRMYDEATELNNQYEALRTKITEMQEAGQSVTSTVEEASPQPDISPEAPAVEEGAVAVEPPDPSQAVEAGVPAAPVAEVVEEPPKPAPPKYITVERTRVEERVIINQEWKFFGISSNVTPTLTDLVDIGGYVSENIISKNHGKVLFLCPFKTDIPIGVTFSQVLKKVDDAAGLIYYPHETLSSQVNNNINLLLQQFLASTAPKGYKVVLVKANKISGDNSSLIIGGLTQQDGAIKQKLQRNFKNIFFDNNIFYKGAWLEEIKSFSERLGLRMMTMVCTNSIIQDQENLKRLINSF